MTTEDLDLDALEDAARQLPAEPWCVHPNGSSVWTGNEYDSSGIGKTEMVCKAGGWEEDHLARMEFIAAFSPKVVLELIAMIKRLREEAGKK